LLRKAKNYKSASTYFFASAYNPFLFPVILSRSPPCPEQLLFFNSKPQVGNNIFGKVYVSNCCNLKKTRKKMFKEYIPDEGKSGFDVVSMPTGLWIQTASC
jgi:hypothetical protein